MRVCAGSHGAGEASETETPLVVWGCGVSQPQDPASFQATRMMFDPRVSTDWGLAHVRRHDVHQADIAPLMAALINVPVPVNNMVSGRTLPLHGWTHQRPAICMCTLAAHLHVQVTLTGYCPVKGGGNCHSIASTVPGAIVRSWL